MNELKFKMDKLGVWLEARQNDLQWGSGTSTPAQLLRENMIQDHQVWWFWNIDKDSHREYVAVAVSVNCLALQGWEPRRVFREWKTKDGQWTVFVFRGKRAALVTLPPRK